MHYKNNNGINEGKICLFDSHTNSVEQIAKFTHLWPWEVATTKDKVDYFICHYKSYNFICLHWAMKKNSLKFLT